MTQTLSTAQQELEDARRERAELDGLIAGLEQQVRAGEASAAEQELGEQYSLQRLAALRQEAAEERVRAAEAAALQERRRAAEAAAQADLEQLGVDRLADALDAAVRALAELHRLGEARQAAIARHARTLVDLGSEQVVHEDGGWVVFEAGGVQYDSRQDGCGGALLVELAQKELVRRAQSERCQAQGFEPLEALPHRVTRRLAERQAGVSS